MVATIVVFVGWSLQKCDLPTKMASLFRGNPKRFARPYLELTVEFENEFGSPVETYCVQHPIGAKFVFKFHW